MEIQFNKMSTIQFSEKNIKLAKVYPRAKNTLPRVPIVGCNIDGQFLRIAQYKISKINAIKFAKWILKSFNHD